TTKTTFANKSSCNWIKINKSISTYESCKGSVESSTSMSTLNNSSASSSKSISKSGYFAFCVSCTSIRRSFSNISNISSYSIMSTTKTTFANKSSCNWIKINKSISTYESCKGSVESSSGHSTLNNSSRSSRNTS